MSLQGSRPSPLVLGLVALVLLILVVLAWLWLRDDGDAGPGAADGGPAVRLAVELYFPGEGSLLVRERRELEVSENPEAQLDALARALVEGPRNDGLFAPLPEGISVRSVSLGSNGVVYIDLVSEEGREEGQGLPAGGSTEERLRVYSLINTLVLNVGEARSAVLLWNGTQPETLSGHLDLTRPLLPDTDLLEPRANAGSGTEAGAAGTP